MRIADYASQIYAKIDATKLVSKANISKDELKALLKHIDTINSLTDENLVLSPRSQSNYDVPTELVPLFWPSAVRYDASDRRATNLIKRDEPLEVDLKGLLNYDEFLVLADKLLSCYKKQVSATSTLEEVRRPINLKDALHKMSVDGRVHDSDGIGWIPYPMNDGVRLYGTSYYNACENEVVEEFIRKFAKLFA